MTCFGMEELAARQIAVKPSGGVLFARNVDGVEKRAARQQILDIFRPDRWDRPLHLLTMPGLRWRFERLLLGMREEGWMRSRAPRRTHFTGVENDRAIYFASAAQMPGLETPDALIKTLRPFPFAETGVKSRYGSFFFADVDNLMQHEQWDGGWDAAWLDYTGPLTVERMATIKQFYERHVRDTLIVTALKARWDAATSRAIKRACGHTAWLYKNLDGVILHSLEYKDTSPMAQFAVRKLK